jgi:hypothetical protein
MFGPGILRNGNLFGCFAFLPCVKGGIHPFETAAPNNMLLWQQLSNFMEAGADSPLCRIRSSLWRFGQVDDAHLFQGFRSSVI